VQLQVAPGVITYMQHFDGRTHTGYNFTMDQFKEKKLICHLSASSIAYDTIGDVRFMWHMKNVQIREMKGMREHITHYDQMDTVITMEPRDFLFVAHLQETMTNSQLREYINRQKMRGSSGLAGFEVEYQKRFAAPFSAFILALIGFALSAKKKKGGMGMGLGLGIGLSAGTTRENSRFGWLIPVTRHYRSLLRIVLGKALCYFMIYAVMGVWLTIAVPSMFHFPLLAHWTDILMFIFPYTLASIFFGMTMSCMVKYRENVMLLMVFVSVPLLFLSGISWPLQNIPSFWQGVSWLFPSTFAIRGYVRLNAMGAPFCDVLEEYRFLWMQVLFYFCTAVAVYHFQIRLSRKDLTRRLDEKRQQQLADAVE
jgi:hypothetical protein